MDKTLEQRVLSRLNWRIVPLVMLMYFVSYIDRVNIGFAALTMNKQLGYSNEVFGLGAAIFFIGYFLFETPSNLIMHKVGARIWIARIMITWGLLSAAMALVTTPMSFYVLRFLLGVAEAGLFPGVIYYLSLWFPKRSRAAATAWFTAAVPISTILGSPISGALVSLPTILGLAGWQWMFIVEAAPAVILGVAVLFVMTDRPEHAKWLADDERGWLVQAMADENAEKAGAAVHNPWKALIDPRVLLLGVIYFGTSTGLYVLSLWSPLMIKEFGLSPLNIGLVNAVPAMFGLVAMIAWARNSDRTNERAWHAALACLLAAAGFFFGAVFGASLPAVLFALTLATIGVSCSKPPLWSMPTLFLSGPAAAGGIALMNAIGNLGGFVGPYMIGWIKGLTGSFSGGLSFVGATLVLSAVLILITERARVKSAARLLAQSAAA